MLKESQSNKKREIKKLIYILHILPIIWLIIMNHINDFNLEFLNVCNRLGRHIWVGGRGGSRTAGRRRLLYPASCRQLQLLVRLGHQLLLRVCLSTWCLGKSLFIIFFNYVSCNIWHLFSSKSVLRRGNLSCFNLAEKSWGFRKKHSVGLPSPNYWLNLSSSARFRCSTPLTGELSSPSPSSIM